MREAKELSYNSGIKVSKHQWLTHMMFVDDLLFGGGIGGRMEPYSQDPFQVWISDWFMHEWGKSLFLYMMTKTRK